MLHNGQTANLEQLAAQLLLAALKQSCGALNPSLHEPSDYDYDWLPI